MRFRKLFACVLCLALTAAVSEGALASERPVVHIIAVGDSASDLGEDVATDARNTVRLFSDAFERAGRKDQLRAQTLVGKKATPLELMAASNGLEMGAGDVIVVMYSGHGCTIAATREHQLCMSAGVVSRRSVLEAMLSRKPRLAVLLTDCCSNFENGSKGKEIVPTGQPRALPEAPNMEWATVEDLFLQHRGLVDITAAEPGYGALVEKSNPGSFFINAAIRVLKTPYRDLTAGLDSDGDKRLQWDELLPQLRNAAFLASRREVPIARQVAYATSLGDWVPGPLERQVSTPSTIPSRRTSPKPVATDTRGAEVYSRP